MFQNEVQLSVIVPIYNAEKYIEKCVESILKQNYLSIEIILVNDGSTDRSGIICERMAERDVHIRVIHTENRGVVKARFSGAKASCGKWITFVDPDDWIEEGAYKEIIENDCDIIVTGICRYFDANHRLFEMPYLEEGIYEKEKIVKEIIPIMLWNRKQGTWALDPSLCTKIFKRNTILPQLRSASEIGCHYGDDSIVIFPMMLNVERIKIVKEIYYNHRQRKTGQISPYINDKDFFQKLYSVYEYLKEQFMKTAYWNLMEDQLNCFYVNSVDLKKAYCDYPVFELSAYFPIDQIIPQSRVVLYGAGKIGKKYWEQNSLYHFCDIISWVDQKYESYQVENCIIESPSRIKEIDFDQIVIAVDNYYIAKEIVSYLKKLGVEETKMIWHSVRVNRKNFKRTKWSERK